MNQENILSNIEVCRLCLTEEGVSCSIFAEGEANLVQKIFECTSIEIQEIDGIPSFICEVCRSKLIICLQFIRQCRKTQQKIRELYDRQFELHGLQNTNKVHALEEIELIEYVPDQEDDHFIDKATIVKPQDEIDEVFVVEVINQANDISLQSLDAAEKMVSEQISHDEVYKVDSTTSDEYSTNCNQDILISTINVDKQNATFLQNDNLSKASCEQSKVELSTKSVIITEKGIKKYKKKCPVCGVLQQNLKQHMNVHSGIRKHVCTFCGKAFSQRGNLTCHLNIHTGNKPHKCDQCDKSFGDPTALKMHKINHSDEPNYQCSLCQTTFRFKHSLQTHLRSHRNERNHACSYCNMAFVTSSSLKKHIRTHTGDRPYKCDLCTKSFICGGHLQQHKKTHLREKVFQCEKCNASFKTKASHKHHINTHGIIVKK